MRSNLREKSSFWNMSFAEMILQIRLQDNGVRILCVNHGTGLQAPCN